MQKPVGISATVFSRRAEYRESTKWQIRALAIFQTHGLPRKQSMTHLNIGIVYYKIGEYFESFKHLRRSLRIGESGGWTHRQCFANIGLGNVYRLTRDFEKARVHLHTAYGQAQQLQYPREEALALEFLGDVYRDEGQPAQARRFYARAMAIGMRIAPEGDIVMEVHRRIGECHGLEKRPAEAVTSLKRALDMSRAQGDRFEEAVTLRVLAEVSRNISDLSAARNFIDQSVAILQEIEARHECAISKMVSANLRLQEMESGRASESRLAQLDEAWTQATQALDLFIRVDVPWWTERCRALVSRLANMRSRQERADREVRDGRDGGKARGYDPGGVIIHASGVMRDLIQLCDIFASSDEPVLITGETGTGKELLARRLHQHSARHDRNLVVVNVAAIPQTMFEREFFGHVKGAFSGADRDSEGYAGRADGGTLFLDEIGDLPLEAQPKLLRLLQEGTYQAIGDPRERRVDIRLVAATNANLYRRVAEGTFRNDLYYRLKILDLDIPPVRERREDILPLLRHCLCVVADRQVDLAEYFNRASLELAEEYDWPGNVREIAMIARRAHLDLKAKGAVAVALDGADGAPVLLTGPHKVEAATTLDPALPASGATERSRILLALEENGGSRLLAAQSLGIGRSTLYRRMEKLGIPTRRS